MPRCGILATVLAVLWAVASGCARGPRADRGVVLRLRPREGRVRQGEPLVLVAEFENTGRRDVYLPPFDPWSRFWLKHDDIRKGKETASSETLVVVRPWPRGLVGGPGVETSVEELHIPPGRRWRRSFDLSEVWGGPSALPPGDYRVCVEYRASKAEGRPESWDLISNTVTIRVLSGEASVPGAAPKR